MEMIQCYVIVIVVIEDWQVGLLVDVVFDIFDVFDDKI